MIKVIELFGGIQATSKALDNIGIKYKSTYIDYDKKVVEVKNKLWGTNDVPRDIRDYHPDKKYDLVVAGFPCQPFSLAGKQQGFDDESGRGKLYLETLRVIREANPDYVILENVKAITFKKHKWIIEEIQKELQDMGYFVNVQIINGKNYLPQNRERVFIMGSKKDMINHIPEKSHNLILKDFLEENVSEEYYLSNEKIINRLNHFNDYYNHNYIMHPKITLRNDWVVEKNNNLWFVKTDKSLRKLGYREKEKNWLLPLSSYYNSNIINDPRGKLSTLTTAPKQILESLNPIKIRSITPRESLRLMGWKDIDIDKIIDMPKSKLYFVAGNSMIIPVMEDILIEMLKEKQNE